MADCNVSIDQNKLPGVKEVCRDFAVLEDHSLAYNLQEQEIESHLASNVHKNRLVQKDLIVAKKLQKEEDEIAKIKSQKQHGDIERQDNEIAQEIQEELIRQAELQRLQEEKDAAIARKLQEKEMKEERRRKKQQESNLDEDYFEDHGAARSLDVDKCIRQKSGSPDLHGGHSSVRSGRNFSPEYYSTEAKRSRYPRQDSAAPQTQLKNSEHYATAEGGHSRHADTYPEHLLGSRGRHGDKYPVYEHAHTTRGKNYGGPDSDGAVKKKEKPARPPPPQNLVERDKTLDRERNRHDRDAQRELEWERDLGKDSQRGREQHPKLQRDREKSREEGHSGDRQGERDRRRQKQQVRGRSRERRLEEDFVEPGHSKDWLMESSASWEDNEDVGRERRDKNRPRVNSIPNEPLDRFRSDEGQADSRESWEPGQGGGRGRERSYSTPNKETAGRALHRGSGSGIGESAEFGLSEATQGLTKLDLREQELRDMEVAKKLQEEELKANSMHVRAAQVAQDEEIARILMEQEKKEYRKVREREKEKAQERERMERRRQEGEYRPKSEDVVRPRTREEYDYQRQKSKPTRPPQPRIHDYENVGPGGYGYSEHPINARPHARPEAAYRGAYQKR